MLKNGGTTSSERAARKDGLLPQQPCQQLKHGERVLRVTFLAIVVPRADGEDGYSLPLCHFFSELALLLRLNPNISARRAIPPGTERGQYDRRIIK